MPEQEKEKETNFGSPADGDYLLSPLWGNATGGKAYGTWNRTCPKLRWGHPKTTIAQTKHLH
jgi:hypothetical protein